MNNNFYKQGIVWGGYPVKQERVDYLISRHIKLLVHYFQAHYYFNKFTQKSFLSAAQAYKEKQSFDGLWRVNAKNMQGKLTTNQGLVEACSFLRVFLERERGVVLTDKQFFAIWALNKQFFIHDDESVNKEYAVFMAACIEYWRGHKVHIAMASDALASAEHKNMQVSYQSLGVNVAFVNSTMSFTQRQEAYQADVVYIGAQQLAREALIDLESLKLQPTSAHFFLDKLAAEKVHSKLLLSGLCSVIISDANLILLELAAHPVLLEQETENNELYTILVLAMAVAKELIVNEDFLVDQEHSQYQLTAEGEAKIKRSTLEFNEFWHSEKRATTIIKDALLALYEYKSEQNYTINNQKIQVVKESAYKLNVALKSLELLISIKEGLPEPEQRMVKSQISYQYFLSHYFRVTGITYSGSAIKQELRQVYGFPSYSATKERKLQPDVYCLLSCSKKMNKLVELLEMPLKPVNGVLIVLRSSELLESVLDALKRCHREAEVFESAAKGESLAMRCEAVKESNKVLIITSFVEFSCDLTYDLQQSDVYILEGYENSLVLRFWQRSKGQVSVIAASDDPIVTALMNRFFSKVYFYLAKVSFCKKKVGKLYLAAITRKYDKFKREQRQKVKQVEVQYRKFYAFLGSEKI